MWPNTEPLLTGHLHVEAFVTKPQGQVTSATGMDAWFISNLIIDPMIAIIIIIGNSIVLTALYREKSLHTVTNCLIASLATADLLTGLFIPFLLLPFFGLPNEFYSCLFVNCSIMILTGISNLHFLAIATERFIAIKFPFWYHANFTVSITFGIATVGWLTGSILGLVPMMGWNNGWNKDHTCGFILVIDLTQHVYFQFIGIIIFPMLLTLLIYISIFVEVRRSSRQIEALRVNTDAEAGQGNGAKPQVKAEIRAAKRFGLVVGIFGLCWFPLEIMNCTVIWYKKSCIECIIAAVWLSHMNSVINPFLYAYGNSVLRQAMKNILLCRREGQSGMNTSEAMACNT